MLNHVLPRKLQNITKMINSVHCPRMMENIICKITRKLEISHVTIEHKRISILTWGSLLFTKNLSTSAALFSHCTSKRRSSGTLGFFILRKLARVSVTVTLFPGK